MPERHDFLKVGWDTVKDIKKRYLSSKFGRPRLKDLKYIAIDEFSVRKNHKYMTVVLDIISGAAVYVARARKRTHLSLSGKGLKVPEPRLKAWPQT